MSHQSIALPGLVAASPPRKAKQASDAAAPPTWFTHGLLMLASGLLFALACASAWLSYHAQVAYVLAHNGEQADAARVWALLLDAGTAGVSLLRLYETLRRRPGMAARISLAGCITASVTMNVLHTPSRSPGGFLVAAVPPVMYAVFLEHLLSNLRSLLVTGEERRGMWRTVSLWVNFPALMWSGRRRALRLDAESWLAASESLCCADGAVSRRTVDSGGASVQAEGSVDVSDPEALVRRTRRGRGPGPKRIAFEAALTEQMRSGDLRLFSEDGRERNAAAYQAAASLPVPLSRGTARRYVVQALPRLGDTAAADGPSALSGALSVS